MKISFITNEQYIDNNMSFEILYGYIKTPFKKALIAYIKDELIYLQYFDNIDDLKNTWKNCTFIQNNILLEKYTKNIYKNNENVKIFLKGTSFQIKVWKELLNIPYGMTSNYSNIAKQINKAKASRAVANAIGKNQISYFIPCHRILRKDGNIGGFAWGIDMKKNMLDFEQE